MPEPIKYIATIANVREVVLAGTADLEFWKRKLADERLEPLARDGRAQVLASALDARFRGIRFQELNFSILVRPTEDEPARDAVYFAQGFNSSRLFAFCERTFFSTPYQCAPIAVDAAIPAGMRLLGSAGPAFSAEMSAGAGGAVRRPARRDDVDWHFSLYLPRGARSQRAAGLVFYARLQGPTEFYPFDPATDRVQLAPSPEVPIFAWLVESGFAGSEWSIRTNATHARSKTIRRIPACGTPARSMK